MWENLEENFILTPHPKNNPTESSTKVRGTKPCSTSTNWATKTIKTRIRLILFAKLLGGWFAEEGWIRTSVTGRVTLRVREVRNRESPPSLLPPLSNTLALALARRTRKTFQILQLPHPRNNRREFQPQVPQHAQKPQQHLHPVQNPPKSRHADQQEKHRLPQLPNNKKHNRRHPRRRNLLPTRQHVHLRLEHHYGLPRIRRLQRRLDPLLRDPLLHNRELTVNPNALPTEAHVRPRTLRWRVHHFTLLDV